MRTFRLGVIVAFAIAVGCHGEDDEASTNAAPAPCADIAIDRFRELAIVDESVAADPRSLNATAGHWSFRYLIGEMTPAGQDPGDFVYAWLAQWLSEKKVNLFKVDARSQIQSRLLCPWLQRSPGTECNPTCTACKSKRLDLASAPLRFIGVANRIDLRETEDVGIGAPHAGEGRFVFALTNGPGDDPASAPLEGTIIMEYELPLPGRSIRYWADRWHALAQHPLGTPEYNDALQNLTDEFTKRDALPERTFGSALKQVRTNEKAFEWQWDLRQFELHGDGLMLVGARNSPDATVYESNELQQWILANREAVMKGQHSTPPALTGGQSQTLQKIRAPQVPEELRAKFAGETCGGCHQVEHPAIDNNFHYSPHRKGIAKLSPFLHDPLHPGTDELSRREGSMQRALCSQ